jgi:hypothetical protein
MLKTEKLEAKKIAYDRPSNKLLAFLGKKFDLVDHIPQNNNFVVFNDYFDNTNFTKKVDYPYEKDNNILLKLSNDSYRNISYGAFSNQGYEGNSKSNSDNKLNFNKKIESSINNFNTPWATSGNADNFVSSSSTYGAYYAFENKKNSKKYY